MMDNTIQTTVDEASHRCLLCEKTFAFKNSLTKHTDKRRGNTHCRAIAPKPRGMPPLTHRGVGRPRMANSYAAARAGMVASPALMAANLKRQLSPMPGGQQGQNSMENILVWI